MSADLMAQLHKSWVEKRLAQHESVADWLWHFQGPPEGVNERDTICPHWSQGTEAAADDLFDLLGYDMPTDEDIARAREVTVG